MGLAGDDLTIAVVPSWALADSTRLGELRTRWLNAGVLRRVVEVLDVDGEPGPLAFVVAGRPRPQPKTVQSAPGVVITNAGDYAQHLQPVLLPRAGRPTEAELRWFAVPLLPGGGVWRTSWGNLPAAEDHALHYLRQLTVAGLPVASALARVGKDVDQEYLELLLSQPPYLRAIVRGRGDLLQLPIPELAEQRDIAARLRDGTADLYELACLFSGVDPRDGSAIAPHGSGARYNQDLHGVLRSIGDRSPRGVAWASTLLDRMMGNDQRALPGLKSWTRLVSALSGVTSIAADAEHTSDLGLKIGMLSGAIAQLDNQPHPGPFDRVVFRQLRDALARQRVKAVGAATISLSIGSSWIEAGKTHISVRIENAGRTPLFDLRLWIRRADDGGEIAADSLRVVEAEDDHRFTLELPGDRLGEDRIALRWEARNVLGEDVKGRTVVTVEVCPASSRRNIGLWLKERRWDLLRDLTANQDASSVERVMAGALLAYREGDEAAFQSGMTTAGGDARSAPMIALMVAVLGRDRLARTILEDAWKVSPDDGHVALALGRTRAWTGEYDGAMSALNRAASAFSDDALPVAAAVSLRRGRPDAAEEQIRGLTLDASAKLAALPYRVLLGDGAALPELLPLVDSGELVIEDIAWVILDLLHLELNAEGRALARAWMPTADDLLIARMCRALAASRCGDAEGAGAELDILWGLGHRAVLDPPATPTALPPNPYVIGKAIQERLRFFGREAELERILGVVAATSSSGVVLLEGERRVGKTSILHQVRSRLPRDTLCAVLNLQELGSAFGESDFWEALTEGLRRAQGLTAPVRRSMPSIRDYRSFDEEVETTIGSGSWPRAVLLIDEFEVLDAAVEAGTCSVDVVGRLRHLVQTRPVGIVIAGAHELSRSRKAYRSPLFGFAVRIQVASLATDAARSLLAQPTESLFAWSPEALTHALALTDAQPFYLQHLGSQVYENRRTRPRAGAVTAGEVDGVVPATIAAAAEHLDALYDALPGDVARRIVQRLAEEPPLDPHGLGRETMVIDAGDEAVLDDLVDRRVVLGGGEVRLVVGLFHRRVAERFAWKT